MTFGNLTVDRLLAPDDLVNEFVTKVLHHFDSVSVLGVDDPDEQEAVRLQLVKRYLLNLHIVQGVVSDGDASRRIGRRELPWWVTGDHVEHTAAISLLRIDQLVPLEVEHTRADGNSPELLDVLRFLECLQIFVVLLRRYIAVL